MCDKLPCGYEPHSGFLRVPAELMPMFLKMGYKPCSVPLMTNETHPLRPLPSEIREERFRFIKRCIEGQRHGN